MAAPGFGFSAGDFIAAVELIFKVSKALRDAGGASENYREVIAELSLLKDVLTQLHSNQESVTSQSHRCDTDPFLALARQQAALTLSILSDFLNRISKFDAKLGPQRPASWYRGFGMKVQWAIFHGNEVDNLRLKVGSQLHTLSILTQLQERSRMTAESLDKKFNDIKLQNDEILRVCLNWDAHGDRLANRLAAPTPLLTNYESPSTNPNNNKTISVSSHTSKNTVFGIQKEFNSSTQGGLYPIAAAVDQAVENSLVEFRGRLNPVSSGIILPTSGQQSPIHQGAIPRIMRQGDLIQRQEDTFSELLLKLVRTVIRDLRSLILRAWLLFPHLMTFYHHLLATIVMPPVLIVAESINFEDVLGQKVTLPYDYYKHWPNFNAFLRRHFRNCPGEKFVTQGQYYILDSQAIQNPNTEIKLVWPTIAFPGCEISMSIKLTGKMYGHGYIGRICLRPGCSGSTEAQGQGVLSCPKCGLTCFHMPGKNDLLESSKPIESIEFGTWDPVMFWLVRQYRVHSVTTKPPQSMIIRLDRQMSAFRKVHLTLSTATTPIQTRPRIKPRRKAVTVWICCNCSHGGMKKTADPCPYCGSFWCLNCITHQVFVR